MTTLICGLVGLVTTLIAWRSGYHAGRADGQLGRSCCWPWSTETRDPE